MLKDMLRKVIKLTANMANSILNVLVCSPTQVNNKKRENGCGAILWYAPIWLDGLCFTADSKNSGKLFVFRKERATQSGPQKPFKSLP